MTTNLVTCFGNQECSLTDTISSLCLCFRHFLCNEYTREDRSKLPCLQLTPKTRNYKRCASFVMYSGGL